MEVYERLILGSFYQKEREDKMATLEKVAFELHAFTLKNYKHRYFAFTKSFIENSSNTFDHYKESTVFDETK